MAGQGICMSCTSRVARQALDAIDKRRDVGEDLQSTVAPFGILLRAHRRHRAFRSDRQGR